MQQRFDLTSLAQVFLQLLTTENTGDLKSPEELPLLDIYSHVLIVNKPKSKLNQAALSRDNELIKLITESVQCLFAADSGMKQGCTQSVL